MQQLKNGLGIRDLTPTAVILHFGGCIWTSCKTETKLSTEDGARAWRSEKMNVPFPGLGDCFFFFFFARNKNEER